MSSRPTSYQLAGLSWTNIVKATKQEYRATKQYDTEN